MTREPSVRGRVLLIAGVLLGALIAGLDLVRADEVPAPQLEDGVVARVNGRPIPRASLERALAAVESDRREGLSAADRERVIERLVEEELLVQGAIELGLAERDRRVRADLAAAMIDLLTARGAEEIADDATLRRFYAEEAAYFRSPPRLRARHVYSRSAGAAARARTALLSGAAASADAATTDTPPVPLPSGLVSTRDLTATLGAAGAREVVALEAGGVSRVIEAAGGYHVIAVIERREGRLPPFDDAREAVLGEYRRRAGERALRSFLDARRGEAEIVRAEAP